MAPVVSAIICTYERYDLLEKAIASLARQTADPSRFEVIVVDNSPDAALSAEIGSTHAGLSNLVWISERKPGLSNARNVGLARAQAPVVAYMDDDAIADPAWIEVIAAAFDGLPASVGCIGGIVDPIWDWPRPSWLHADLDNYLSVVNWQGGNRPLAETEWLAGTNVAYRAEPLRAINGFETSLGRIGAAYSLLSNDETDVAQRLAERGYSCHYIPAMRVDHLVDVRRLEQEWFRRRVAWQAVSDYMRDPRTHYEKSASYWEGVTWSMSQLPAHQRNANGFHIHQTDPDGFKRQLSAIYNMVIATLSGFRGVQTEPLE